MLQEKESGAGAENIIMKRVAMMSRNGFSTSLARMISKKLYKENRLNSIENIEKLIEAYSNSELMNKNLKLLFDTSESENERIISKVLFNLNYLLKTKKRDIKKPLN